MEGVPSPLLVLCRLSIGKAVGESDGPEGAAEGSSYLWRTHYRQTATATASGAGTLVSHCQREHPEVDWNTQEGTDNG